MAPPVFVVSKKIIGQYYFHHIKKYDKRGSSVAIGCISVTWSKSGSIPIGGEKLSLSLATPKRYEKGSFRHPSHPILSSQAFVGNGRAFARIIQKTNWKEKFFLSLSLFSFLLYFKHFWRSAQARREKWERKVLFADFLKKQTFWIWIRKNPTWITCFSLKRRVLIH